MVEAIPVRMGHREKAPADRCRPLPSCLREVSMLLHSFRLFPCLAEAKPVRAALRDRANPARKARPDRSAVLSMFVTLFGNFFGSPCNIQQTVFLPVLLLCLTAVAAQPAGAAPLDFTLHKLGEKGSPAVLIVGGIQGDEPGGFSAASLLVTSYRFTKGTVWVVPNLNFPSIVRRSRGVHGDMNRKFAALSEQDPEYHTVRRIQELIRTPGLGLVLNLHDGGGFYNPVHESEERNPGRWGQCLIIDMAEMPHPAGQLEKRGHAVLGVANRHLLDPGHRLHLKNTQTHLGNAEMEKSLSWYAVRQGVPSFGLEASKNFSVDVRAYYHLLMIEALLAQAGVRFERRFALSPQGIRAALQDDLRVTFTDNRVALPLDNPRPRLGGSIPLPRDAMSDMRPSKPILTVTESRKEMAVHYGNRVLTRFRPDWRETDTALSGLTLVVDGKPRKVRFGEVVEVNRSFEVQPVENYRVNAIGAEYGPDESGKKLRRRDFKNRYSLDRDSRTYRIEAYRGQRFAGMILVRFGKNSQSPKDALPAIAGRESALGM